MAAFTYSIYTADGFRLDYWAQKCAWNRINTKLTQIVCLSHLLWKLGLVGMFLVCDSVAFSRGRQRLECFLTSALYAVNLTDGLIINQGISPLFLEIRKLQWFPVGLSKFRTLLAILRSLDNMYCMWKCMYWLYLHWTKPWPFSRSPVLYFCHVTTIIGSKTQVVSLLLF